MGGREYEAIAQGPEEPTFDALIEVLRQGALALPSFASAGPYNGRRGTIEGAEGLNATQRAALATLYSALMTAQLIESLGTAGEIFVDGPLARNATESASFIFVNAESVFPRINLVRARANAILAVSG